MVRRASDNARGCGTTHVLCNFELIKTVGNPWVVQLGEKEAKRRPPCSLQLPEEGKRRARCWSLSLVSNDRNGTKLHQGRFSRDTRKKIFTASVVKTRTGFLACWLMPRACQFSKGIWIMLSVTFLVSIFG